MKGKTTTEAGNGFFYSPTCGKPQCWSKNTSVSLASTQARVDAAREAWPSLSLVVVSCRDCHHKTFTGLGFVSSRNAVEYGEASKALTRLWHELKDSRDINVPIFAGASGREGMIIEVLK